MTSQSWTPWLLSRWNWNPDDASSNPAKCISFFFSSFFFFLNYYFDKGFQSQFISKHFILPKMKKKKKKKKKKEKKKKTLLEDTFLFSTSWDYFREIIPLSIAPIYVPVQRVGVGWRAYSFQLANCLDLSYIPLVKKSRRNSIVFPLANCLALSYIPLVKKSRRNSISVCHFVLVFFSPFSIAITSLGEERANLSAFRTFVRFVLVWICRFPLPLGVWEGLRFVIVALPGLFSYLFCNINSHLVFCVLFIH